MYSKANLLLGFMLPLAFLASERTLRAEEPVKRWAVVASAELQEMGLPDLLTAQLSSEEGIELVERDQIALATRELELSAHLSPDAANKRLQLGRQLKADVLLLLTIVEREKKKFIQLTISDANYGARLEFDHHNLIDGKIGDSVQWVVDVSRKTRAKYKDGVRYLIGVSPFLSKNLTHDYDQLQIGYASLLESSLRDLPGVALLEIAEARAISDELKIDGKSLTQLRTPLFVEGEFAMSSSDQINQPLVNMSVRIVDGRSVVEKQEHQEQSLEQVVDLLRDRLPQRIAKLVDVNNVTPATRDQEFTLLKERAARFAEVGAYEHANSIREAALLLKDDAELRIALVRDSHAFGFIAKIRFENAMRKGQDSWEARSERCIARFHIAASHIEHLVRTRSVNPAEASYMFADHAKWLGAISALSEKANAPIDVWFWRIYPHMHELDTSIECRFYIQSNQSRPANERFKMSAEDQFREWTRHAIHICFNGSVLISPKDDSKSLDNLFRFLTTVEPSSEVIPEMAYLIFSSRNGFNWMIESSRFKVAEIRDFYNRLIKTDQAVAKYYGRCGLLSLQLYVDGSEIDENAIAEMDALVKETLQRDAKRYPFSFVHWMRIAYKDFQAKRGAVRVKKEHKLPTDLIPPKEAVRLSFEPLDIETGDWTGLIQCGDDLDIIWSSSQLFAMRKPGTLETVLKLDARADLIQTVVWDNEFIWVATKNSNVIVVNVNGKELNRFDIEQESLARCVAIELQPMSAGRCLAVGRSDDRRVWFAELKCDGTESSFKIFHTATKPLNAERSNGNDPETMFDAPWIFPYENGNDRKIFVGRRAMGFSATPLSIDTKTLSVASAELPIRIGQTPIGSAGDKILYTDLRSVHVLEWIDYAKYWHSQKAFSYVSEEYGGGSKVATKTEMITLSHDGWLYHPARSWHRINQKTAEIETLSEGRLPYRYDFTNYAVSAHFGIVAWSREDQLYRIHVRDKPQTFDVNPDWHYAHVPAEHRAQHIEAVAAIEKLGGRVDAVCDVAPYGVARFIGQPVGTGANHAGEFRKGWSTVVYLPESWKGRDGKLSVLAKLYQPRAVMIFGANVSNEGVKHLAKLSKLEMLMLVETAVTNEGLEDLTELEQLAFLRLEGVGNGEQFSNAGLQPVGKITSLVELHLYGPGFTNDGIASLRSLKNLRTLSLYNTQINKEGIAEINSVSRHRFFKVLEFSWRY